MNKGCQILLIWEKPGRSGFLNLDFYPVRLLHFVLKTIYSIK